MTPYEFSLRLAQLLVLFGIFLFSLGYAGNESLPAARRNIARVTMIASFIGIAGLIIVLVSTM